MSVRSGGTALKPFNSGGSCSGSAGSAGMSITFLIAHLPLSSRCQSHIELERSFSETTTPTKPSLSLDRAPDEVRGPSDIRRRDRRTGRDGAYEDPRNEVGGRTCRLEAILD